MLTPAPNYPAWKFYLDLFRDAAFVAMGLYVWWSNREKVTSARFVALEKKVAERATVEATEIHGRRITDVEYKLKNVSVGCNGHSEMCQRLDGHNDRLGQHKELIDLLTGEVKHLPKNDDLAQVHKRVDEVFGIAQAIKGEIKGIANNMSLILEHHLKER